MSSYSNIADDPLMGETLPFYFSKQGSVENRKKVSNQLKFWNIRRSTPLGGYFYNVMSKSPDGPWSKY